MERTPANSDPKHGGGLTSPQRGQQQQQQQQHLPASPPSPVRGSYGPAGTGAPAPRCGSKGVRSSFAAAADPPDPEPSATTPPLACGTSPPTMPEEAFAPPKEERPWTFRPSPPSPVNLTPSSKLKVLAQCCMVPALAWRRTPFLGEEDARADPARYQNRCRGGCGLVGVCVQKITSQHQIKSWLWLCLVCH